MLCRRILLIFWGLLPAGIILGQIQAPKAVSLADKIIVVVGDHVILYSDITNSVADIKRQGAIAPNAECLITEEAIISKLLMLQALKDSLPVTDEEVEAEIDLRLSYYFKQSPEVDQETIQKIKESARGPIKERRLASAMQEKIVGNLKVSPAEVKSFFDRIPKDKLPFLDPEMEVGQIIFYPIFTTCIFIACSSFQLAE